jgi:CheY-like chemotaxis protein
LVFGFVSDFDIRISDLDFLSEAHWIMPTILVVDDTAVDRFLAGSLLEEVPGWHAVYAGDGREALAYLKNAVPHLVLTP